MSIDTLLEAAKFVEWSAQIGYGTRGPGGSDDGIINAVVTFNHSLIIQT